MRCARPAPPRTTRTRTRSGSRLSPTVKAPALAALAPEEPASRSAGKPDPANSKKSHRGNQSGCFLVARQKDGCCPIGSGKVLINAAGSTGQVGTGTKMSGYPTIGSKPSMRLRTRPALMMSSVETVYQHESLSAFARSFCHGLLYAFP